MSNNCWLKFLKTEFFWKKIMKLQKYFELIMNRSTKVLCPDCAVQCNGSKQKSQLFHYTITIVTANHNWWHEKIWITSNEFLIGNMYLILFISYSILLCKNRTLRWIKRLVNLINILLFISGMFFYKSYKTHKCVATVFPTVIFAILSRNL